WKTGHSYLKRRVNELGALAGFEKSGRGRCLEIGVGTGRIALPLALAGVAMAGVDISAGMVGLLVEKSGGRAPFPLALADATRLPFRTGTFGAAVASHVLHLIPPWREAIAELARVVRRGGLVLASLSGRPADSVLPDVRARFTKEAGAEPRHLGLAAGEELDEAFAAIGASNRVLPSIIERRSVRLDELIGRLERGEFSFAWPLDEVTRHEAAERVREWARAEYGSLEEPREVERALSWRAYDLGE
ncbi:MAG: methyltransferase domain-containing protein, partial [Actinomycetota bacterium]